MQGFDPMKNTFGKVDAGETARLPRLHNLRSYRSALVICVIGE